MLNALWFIQKNDIIGPHHLVMSGLVPAIHVFLVAAEKPWMAGTSPGMTSRERAREETTMELHQLRCFVAAGGAAAFRPGGAAIADVAFGAGTPRPAARRGSRHASVRQNDPRRLVDRGRYSAAA